MIRGSPSHLAGRGRITLIMGVHVAVGDRTYKLPPITTSEYGRYVKSLGEPRGGPHLPCHHLTSLRFISRGPALLDGDV